MSCKMSRQTTPAHRLTGAFVALLLCSFIATSLPTPVSQSQPSADTPATNNASDTNFNCPEDCHCVIAAHTHKPLLHAKCSSLKGLKSDAPLQTTVPIHSIDLSYLKLPRLAHALNKLRDLTSADLSHNELHEIGHLGRRIKKLNLKGNRITSAKLAKLPQHVQVLNLQHNDITYLPLEFTKLTHLQTLELSHNQINCTCDTLEVRNWLQQHHVFMEHPVTCTYPNEVKGKPWLQVKQSDMCEKEKRGWYADEEENELMLGDQPVEGSGDIDNAEEELGKDFLPIEHKVSTSKPADLSDVEGSGDLSDLNVNLASIAAEPAQLLAARSREDGTTVLPVTEEEDEEDGSGSGGGLLFIPHLPSGPIITDDFEVPDAHAKSAKDDDYDNKPVEEPAQEGTPSPAIFGAGMGIFDDANNGQAETDSPVQEEAIVPVVQHNVAAANEPDTDVITDGPDVANSDVESSAVMHANAGAKDDSDATYLLMGVIALILVGLLLFVAIKRCKHNSATQRAAENQRQTELLDMDKKNPGKPITRNGVEHIPLIPEKSKADQAKPVSGTKPYDSSDVKDGPGQQQPLINGSGNGKGPSDVPAINAPANEQAPHEYYPITPRYPTPKSPRASKYAQYPQSGEPNNNNNDSTDNAYQPPVSPKTGRYSPVYSPETGRVKVRLTETPKPKTPMLVTRSKSNAGDIIATPVYASNLGVPGVHVAPVGGSNGAANGHLEH